jgi:RimJ/RimL family protein N-acetyltransferase
MVAGVQTPATPIFEEPEPATVAELPDFRLRSFRRGDIPAVQRVLCRPEVWRSFRPLDGGVSLPPGLVEKYLAAIHMPGFVALAGAATDTDEVIGATIARFGEGAMARTAELFGWVAPEYWNSGIARRANDAFVEWLFRERGVLRAFAYVYHPNKAAIGMLRSSGFRLEGRERCAAVKDGHLMDRLVFTRLNPVAQKMPRTPDREAMWLVSSTGRT